MILYQSIIVMITVSDHPDSRPSGSIGDQITQWCDPWIPVQWLLRILRNCRFFAKRYFFSLTKALVHCWIILYQRRPKELSKTYVSLWWTNNQQLYTNSWNTIPSWRSFPSAPVRMTWISFCTFYMGPVQSKTHVDFEVNYFSSCKNLKVTLTRFRFGHGVITLLWSGKLLSPQKNLRKVLWFLDGLPKLSYSYQQITLD